MARPLQEKIQTFLNDAVAAGDETGAQVVIYREGEPIVEAQAGVADPRTSNPVKVDTLFPVYSTTKGIMATVIHILAERGKLDYDRPIAFYWPEFAAEGKGDITLRMALAHTSGLPYMPVGIGPDELYDWDTMCRAMAALKPSFPAGTRFMYHPVTYSWLLGEVARRVDGRALQAFIEEEISGPLGIEREMFVGVPAELEPTVAVLEEISGPPPADPPTVNPVPPNPAEQGLATCMEPLGFWMNDRDARMACIPGSNGIMSARAVARHYAAMLPGGVDGVELVSESRLHLALESQPLPGGPGETIKERRGLGYGLGDGGMPDSFGHGGYGGSAGFGNTKYRLGVGVTRNRFSPHDLSGWVGAELRKELGIS